NAADSYAQQRIELRAGAWASHLDAARKVVELDSGAVVAYDRLLVTTGGRNRALTAPGAELPGVFQLRTVDDCDRIRAVAQAGRRAVVVGLGFIGCEVAASLRQMKVSVSAIEGQPVPLARVLGPEVGRIVADIHRDKGVEVILEDTVAAFEGARPVEPVRPAKAPLVQCHSLLAPPAPPP